jgi:type IV secretion system protein VirB6
MNNVSKKVKILIIVVCIVAILSIIAVIPLICFGVISLKGSCWMRYNKEGEILKLESFKTSRVLSLNANMNHLAPIEVRNGEQNPTFQPNPAGYGKWFDAGIFDPKGEIELSVQGSVSLCKSKLHSDFKGLISSDTRHVSTPLPIPRVGDSEFLAIKYPFIKNHSDTHWRNLVQIKRGDKLRILVKPPIDNLNSTSTSVQFTNAFGEVESVDCSATQTSEDLSPICGRSSIYKGQYLSRCKEEYYCDGVDNSCRNCERKLNATTNHGNRLCTYNECESGFLGWGAGCPKVTLDAKITYNPVKEDMPLPYSSGKTFFYMQENARNSSIEFPRRKWGDYNQHMYVGGCGNSPINDLQQRIDGYKFWMTHGEGLIYRYNTENTRESITREYEKETLSFKSGPKNLSDGVSAYEIFNEDSISSIESTGYFQLGNIFPTQDGLSSIGGYILYLQQTSCLVEDGKYISDGGINRGQIEYVLTPSDIDINDVQTINSQYPRGLLDLTNTNSQKITIPQTSFLELGSLKLWLKIKNNQEDYADSSGTYSIEIKTKETVGKFQQQVFDPLFKKINELIEKSKTEIFKNITCYGQDSGKCINFFNYIKAILTLYIMVFGFLVLLGRIRLDKAEILQHIVKVLIVGGLINGNTFLLFNDYFIPIIFNYTDSIMGAFSGAVSESPFAYLDDALTKILLNRATIYQLLALLSSGITGFFMFIMTFVGIFIFLCSGFQAVIAYLFAKLILVFLIGVAPLFLTFMLFERTKTYFHNWISNVFRYMIEPVVINIGLAIYTKLFILYLDKVLAYSVCFKCAIAFKVPNIFSFISKVPSTFQNVYVFCLSWFAPWGLDSYISVNSLSIPDILGMCLIAYMMIIYVSYASSLVQNLTGNLSPGTGGMSRDFNAMSVFDKVKTSKRIYDYIDTVRGNFKGRASPKGEDKDGDVVTTGYSKKNNISASGTKNDSQSKNPSKAKDSAETPSLTDTKKPGS